MGKLTNEKYIIKSFNCEHCGKTLECKIEKKQLEELKETQLFNFVIMHANDHTLIVSVDGRGNIRRSRVASLSSNSINKAELSELKNYQILEESKNLIDAFNSFIKLQKGTDE
ncbi:MAG: hypothetical protein ACTSYV_03515 [Candidatus Heimdallarchaeaceae archaeon]